MRNRVTPLGDIAAVELRGAWTGNRRNLFRGTHRRQLHRSRWPDLPAGTFVLTGDGPALVLDDAIVGWTVRGYAAARARPAAGAAQVITPPSTVAALRAGYRPQIDQAATTRLS